MSKEALEVAKRLAYVIWQTKYEDDQLYLDEKLPKNESVSTGHPDNINFFYGQFDHINQAIFGDLVESLLTAVSKRTAQLHT